MEELQGLRTPPEGAQHLSKEAVGRFVANQSTRAEAKAVVRHLLKQCPRCARRLLDLTGALQCSEIDGGRRDEATLKEILGLLARGMESLSQNLGGGS